MQGYNIYSTKCTTCHKAKDIPSYSEEEWTKAIAAMAPKARLTAAETETVSRYIYTVRDVNGKK